MIRTGSLVVVALAAAVCADTACAQFYKGKTVTMIINYPAGGPTDIEGRIVAQHLPAHIPGKPTIVIKNVGGAGGVIGTNQLAEAAPNGDQTQQSRRNPSHHFPLDSCNENLPEKRTHRSYASRPGGMPRRVFCCAHASYGQPMTSDARHHTRPCQHRDADRRLRQRAAIVSRLFFTMKIPTTACGGAVR
jgi:hypothetical protein